MPHKSKRMVALQKKAAEYKTLELSAAVEALKGLEGGLPKAISPVSFDQAVEVALRSVSYTHLTLPTILLV